MIRHRQNKKRIKKALAVLVLGIIVVSLSAQFGGGNGTENDPWVVATATHLNNVREYLGANHSNKYFIQTANINLGVEPWNEEEGWVPIGTFGTRFTGKYNGNNFIINNLTIERDASLQGLFGYTEGAEIKNVRITNAEVRGGESSGILIGNGRSTNVSNCYIEGSVTAIEKTGIIIGNSYACNIQRSYSAGIVTSSANNGNAGGVVGYQTSNGIISDTFSTAEVHGTRTHIGGIVGNNLSGTLRRCYATGHVKSANPANPIGGLVGNHQTGTIVDCYWNLETTGQTVSLGGGEAKTTLEMIEQDTFENWDFLEIWTIGNDQLNTYPYFRAQEGVRDINYPTKVPVADMHAYVSGHQEATVTWSPPAYGQPNHYGIFRDNMLIETVPSETTRFRDEGLLLYSRLAYQVAAYYQDNLSPYSKVVNVTPIPNGYAGGVGTEDEPYRIRTGAQLQNIRYNPHAHYQQAERINAAEVGAWTPIGDAAAIDKFTGSFDGNEFVITGLFIDGANVHSGGLFGYVGDTEAALIKNVTLEEVTITARRNVGALASQVEGGSIIQDCHVSDVNLVGTDNTMQLCVGGLIANGVDVNIINCSVTGGNVRANGGYVGGLIGSLNSGSIVNSYSTCNVDAYVYVGGFAGYVRGTISNSYALGGVTATSSEVGGFVGSCVAGTITNCYSIGRMMVQDDAINVGGFVGRTMAANINNCYWNVQNSGIATSPAGIGRNTNQMTYPYGANTYVDWDFDEIWEEDIQSVVNGGYPYHYWHPLDYSEHPHVATDPTPADRTEDVSINLERLSWRYTESILFNEPIGFRVYMNITGTFGENDPFVWVPYSEDEENYSSEQILPETLLNRTIYYWKVVPTTIPPDDRGDASRRQSAENGFYGRSSNQIRGDAENVPIWRFTTEKNPNPIVARDPLPANGAIEVSLKLEELSWTYTNHANYTDAVGFKVYFNTEEEFGDDFEWIEYVANQTRYVASEILPDSLEYGKKYYWTVIPTTDGPDRSDNRRNGESQRHCFGDARGDAANCPVWSFTAKEVKSYPQIAVNPQPEHLARGVSTSLELVSWDYIEDPDYANPVGFRVYMNMTGQFGSGAPYSWVDYEEGQVSYQCSEILPLPLDADATYYWRVIPTTDAPDGERLRNNRNIETRDSSQNRGDAEGNAIWRFTTADTSVEDKELIPYQTVIHSNYPNPFNPQTTIHFSLAEAGNTELVVYDVRGRKVSVLISRQLDADEHRFVWEGRNDQGDFVGSGVYFAHLRVNNVTIQTRRMLLIK